MLQKPNNSLRAKRKPNAKRPSKGNDPTSSASPGKDSELILAFVGAVGVDLKRAEQEAAGRLKTIGYSVVNVRITKDVLPKIVAVPRANKGEFERVMGMMNAGNLARKMTGMNAILALGVASFIGRDRAKHSRSRRTAYLIHSLKHPEEVAELRSIYPRGFYVIGVNAAPDRRLSYLVKEKNMSRSEAQKVMARDMNEELPHGQCIVDTFHLADFFVRLEANNDRLSNSIARIIDIMFGDFHRTPNFGEYAMFLAFAASLRSGDLSRQVGAVVARGGEILGTGANDCPKPGGGLYWPVFDERTQSIEDAPNGRDAVRGYDSNKQQQQLLTKEIAAECAELGYDERKITKILNESRIADLTEFGRMVHAEMEALLSCARNRTDPRGATLYCTTFPCHNCAKHIIAAGIERVVFVEPYLKSKAIELHNEALQITYDAPENPVETKHVLLEPFVGVGPRRFFDFFSMELGSGSRLVRKDSNGKVRKWEATGAILRVPMISQSSRNLEADATKSFESKCSIAQSGKKLVLGGRGPEL
jgi:cytidine deaminase